MSDIAEERDTATIAGKFAEALGFIEEAAYWLAQVNEQYEDYADLDDIRLVTEYGLAPYNPATDFWLQTEQAEERIKDILNRLQRVQRLVPKEKEVVP